MIASDTIFGRTLQRRLPRGIALALVTLTAVACEGGGDADPVCTGDCVSRIEQTLVSAISPVADAYVRDGSSASTSFGTAGTLVVKRQSSTTGNSRRTYLEFPLSTVTGKVTLARLRLFGSRPSASTTSGT